jgi:hypothetical protein
MFDKYKERYAKLEEDHESVRKIRLHFKANGKTYLVGAGCFGSGYLMRGKSSGIKQVVDNFNIKYKSPTNNIVLAALGDPGNVVQNPRTRETWPSQGALARNLKVTPALVSAYFHGKIPNLKGEEYIILGKAGQPLA